ncbi:hypothetical protein AB205_0148150 [Aquarana catesbeiana]|uniref:Protein lifeguard 2 n=1 Tax=Aquarana catesbeiana TaxID=8400 RepID=A0A2G9RDL2_AQUCT|nr:hypothetical protein AB205_0148150 [Aquarana catesbeiana]
MLTSLSWEDARVRRSFIRKVYSILSLQLLVTVSIVALFTFCVVFFTTYLVLACCSGPRSPAWPLNVAPYHCDVVFSNKCLDGNFDDPRCAGATTPASSIAYSRNVCNENIAFWGHAPVPARLSNADVWTLSMSYVTGMLSSYYNTTSVILCLGITALVCISVTIFSFQTKVDFTSCHGVLFVLVMVLFFSGLFLVILIPFQYVPWLHAVYAALGAIVFTLFLAFDTQILMGSRKFTLSPEEYIFGALNIYLDIIYIFTFFLQLFGTTRD